MSLAGWMLPSRDPANPVPAGRLRPALAAGVQRLRGVARDVVDFVYPPLCPLCACDAVGRGPCEACDADLTRAAAEAYCPCCGKPVGGAGPCPWCDGRGQGPVKRVARLSVHDGPARRLVHLAKFNGRWDLAELLADRLHVQPRVRQVLEESDVLVPVPLHRWRQVGRGYNQALVLARRLGQLSRRPTVEAAVRVRATGAQTSLTSVTARQQNVRGAFALCDPEAVAGRRVAILDDVLTTGATLRALAYALEPARPAGVAAVVVAVADPRGAGFGRA